MKNKRLFDALSYADDKYVEEASVHGVLTSKRKARRILSVMAACFCAAVIGVNLWLFIPFSTDPPRMEKYADSEYYEIIYRINALQVSSSVYKNNYEKYIKGKLFDFSAKEDSLAIETVSGSGNMSGAQENYLTNDSDNVSSYVEVTDNQVQGIIESDYIKRSSTHIFYMHGRNISAYSIAGDESECVGSITLKNSGAKGFFLSEDCSTVIVVSNRYSNGKDYTSIVTVDVTDPSNMKLKGEIVADGGYFSSRLVDGELLLMTRFCVYTPDYDDITTFVPHIGEEGNKEPVSMDGIIYPDKLTEANYTVICKLDANTLELVDSSAFLSYSTDAYVSSEYIFVAREYSGDAYEEADGWLWRDRMTEIAYITYDGFEKVNTVSVEGYIKDQYSLDQKDDVLRIVTTTSSSRYKKADSKSRYTREIAFGGGTNASLYCVDIKTGNIIASVEDFAPVGETVRSVRFDGDSAYVCTAIQLSDPVFFFDLSDLDNITYKETGTIEGFSTSLINMGNGFLLGIGEGDQGLKLEIYKETATGVESYCKYEYRFGDYSHDYKAYYVDRENQLIGLGIWQRASYSKAGYVVLHFDGTSLRELLYEDIGGSVDNMRGVYIDGYMYMFGYRGVEGHPADFKACTLQWQS